MLVESPEDVERVSKEIDKMEFMPFSMKQMLDGVNSFSKVIQALLGGIGTIALFVASFGIINTMIMSIYERIREIGIMKVIGASLADIKLIFLLEAAFIGIMGGLVGVFLGWSVSFAVNFVAGNYFASNGGDPITVSSVPLWLILFAVGFAAFVGLVSGLYPEIRASKLSPLSAMRQE